MQERVAASSARNAAQGVRSTHAPTAARFASLRAISAGRPPTPSAQRSPSSASSTQSIEGVLIVSPLKMPSISLPPLVRRKIFGNGQDGVKLSSRATARGDRASIPCAASPPSTFCQDQVTTSSLSHGSSIANTAEVASQITSPSRAGEIQPPSGTRTPDVVPFQAKTTSWSKSTAFRSGRRPYGAASTRASARRSCLTMSFAQPSEKLSKASTSTLRGPSSDQSAISIAPVSDAGTMPSRQSAGMPRIARERSMTSARRAFGALARWLRARYAPLSASSVKPGRLAQGPEEKLGLRGRTSGAAIAMTALPSRREAPRWGGVTRRGSYARVARTSSNLSAPYRPAVVRASAPSPGPCGPAPARSGAAADQAG